jgi:hypothetical protein
MIERIPATNCEHNGAIRELFLYITIWSLRYVIFSNK